MKPTKRPNKEALIQLALGVEDIINEFAWLGFSKPEQSDAGVLQGALPGLESVDERASVEANDAGMEDEDEESHATYRTFEREDIEIGIDSLISRMIKNRLIDKEKTGRQPTLSRIFTIIFGESHPILEFVNSFEQHVKGYFDTIEYKDMQSAFNDLLQIQTLINQELRAKHA